MRLYACARLLRVSLQTPYQATDVLEHLRVIELGQVIAGTFGGMILSDLGARVIKVEPPGGDRGRRSAIYSIGEESAIHVMHNRNKKSVVLDLKTEGGRQTLLDLVRTADAVVENFRPGVLQRLGLDFDRMREANPKIVLVSVSGFGIDSPYREFPAYDLILQAMTGHMSIMGEAGRPPVIMGIPIADLLAGVFAAVAVLAGVEGRRERGRGEHFDLAMFDVMVEMLAHVGTLYLNSGIDQQPQGSAHPFITPWQAFRCRDGAYIVVAPREEHFWTMLCEAVGHPELAQRPEFADARSRQAHRDELLPLLEKIFSSKEAGEWLEILQTAGVPSAPVNRMPAVFEDPNVSVRRMIRSFPVGDGVMRAVGNAIKIAGHAETPATPPPVLGGDTEEVLRSLLNYGPQRIAELEEAGVFSAALRKNERTST
jgi:CoA:oxalate CoA-transferase